MFKPITGKLNSQLESIKANLSSLNDLPFRDVLDPSQIIEAFSDIDWAGKRNRIHTLPVVIWMFLSQVISSDKSCSNAVSKLNAYRSSIGESVCSMISGAYKKARQELSGASVAKLTKDTAQKLTTESIDAWNWKNREVKLVDGSTVSMPDTKKNKEYFGPNPTQKTEISFPIARILCVFSLSCGAIVEATIGKYMGKGTGETSLFHQIIDCIKPKDVVLADRYFAGFVTIYLVSRQGADIVTRQNVHRKKFLKGAKRLNKNEYLITLRKPPRPGSIDGVTFQEMPETIDVRYIRLWIKIRGFRTKKIEIITTLTDIKKYPAEEVAELYRKRWCAEINLRYLKSSLGMDVLSCKSPDMIKKEFWMYLMAYNLIRTLMAQSAMVFGLDPQNISFKATMQIAESFKTIFSITDNSSIVDVYLIMLWAIAQFEVGTRPDRYEPRKIKRRPKITPLLTISREKERALMSK